MSAPKFVNTKDGTCWTRRAATRGGLALYAPEGVCSCPEFVMATEVELAELGIVGSADVLPVPMGPQQPPFPPAPRTFEEKLRQDVARLQGLLAEAVRDAHRARSERDLMRERVSGPFGCTYCGVEKRSHGRRYIGGSGMHAWERPSDEQVKARMLARRVARSPLPATPELEQLHNDLAGVSLSLYEEELTAERLRWALASAKRGRARLRARVAALLEERHSTNESVSEAAEALRVQRDRIAELETLLATARTEAIADVGDWLDEVGEKNAAYLVRTVDVPAARAMRPVLPQAITEDGCSCPPAAHPHQVGCLLDEAREGEPTDVQCSKCGDPVHWVKSTNSDGGFWRHRFIPGRVLDHFGEVAGSEGCHPFEAEYQGESDAKRRLPNCKACGRPATHAAHDGDVRPQVRELRNLLVGQRAAIEDPHDSPLHHPYRLGHDLPVPESCRLDAAGLDEVGRHFSGGGA